jgi:hypothetical protein
MQVEARIGADTYQRYVSRVGDAQDPPSHFVPGRDREGGTMNFGDAENTDYVYAGYIPKVCIRLRRRMGGGVMNHGEWRKGKAGSGEREGEGNGCEGDRELKAG